MDELSLILTRLDSPDWQVRADAALELGKFPDDENALQGLVKALYDPSDTAVTEAAVETLLQRGGFEVTAILRAAINSDADLADHIHDFLGARWSSEIATVLLTEWSESSCDWNRTRSTERER